MKPNKGAKRSTLRQKRTRGIKRRRCGKGTRRCGKKVRGGGILGQSKLIVATNELVNDAATRNLFQDAINRSHSDVKSAIAFFVSGSARLQTLIDKVIQEAKTVQTTDKSMKDANHIISNGSSDELISKAIITKNINSLSTIGAHEAALKIINPKIDEYEMNNLTEKENVLIDKFVEQLEPTQKKIIELYKAVKFETHKSYVSRMFREF